MTKSMLFVLLLVVGGFLSGFSWKVVAGADGADRNHARVAGVSSIALSDAARVSLQPEGEPVSGGMLSKFWIEPKTLNNLLRTTASAGKICKNYLFPPLLRLDPNSFELVPELAFARPSFSEDRKTLRFQLRPGVRWHQGKDDGTPVEVTTADVQYSWDMLHHPELLVPALAWLNRFEHLKVVDEYTFEVSVDEPYFRAEFDFGNDFRLMPAHLGSKDAEGFQNSPLGRAPVGYGPFRFDKWEEDRQIVLQRNPEYWDHDGRPFYIGALRFVFLRDPNQAVDLFRRGELDIIPVQKAQDFEQAKEDPELQERASFHEYYLPRWVFLAWNNLHWAFSDARVRRAMTQFYPRELVRDRFYLGHAAVMSGPLPVNTPEYDASIEPLPFDPAKARSLLAEAGFADTDGNGILDKGGKDFVFDINYVPTRVPALEQGLVLLQQELKKAGVVAQLQPLEFTVILDRVRDGKFAAAQLGWESDPLYEDLYPILHSSQAKVGFNYASYSSAECDALLDQFRDEFDAAKRLEIAHKIHRRVHEDQPCTYLFNTQSIVLVSSRLRNVNITRSGAHYTDWWIAE